MKRFILFLVVFLIVLSSIAALAQERKFASWYLLEGIKDYEQGLYVKAIVDLKSAIHLNPNLVIAYKYLGLSYSKMYLWEQAAREYNKILFYNPAELDRENIIQNITEWEKKKEYLTASARYSYYVIKYREKVWSEPYNLLNYLGLAEIYECERDFEKAGTFYRILVEEAPDKQVFKLYLAETLTLSDKYKKAEAIYRDVLEREPLNPEAVLGLNMILKRRHENISQSA